MPLVVHRSSRAERLVEALAGVLDVPPDDPFAPDLVAVHSGGLEHWLAMQLAQHNGICAGVAFPRPEALSANLCARALGEDPKEITHWSRGRLLWALLAALPTVEDHPALAPVAKYLNEDGPAEKTLRSVTLCQRLAAIFEAYGTYRPDLAEAWQSLDAPGWEPPLWRAVEQKIGKTHLAAWSQRLRESHTIDEPGRICIFCVSTLPPLIVQCLGLLARSVDIHLFVLHPSPKAWDRLAEALPNAPSPDLSSYLDRPDIRPQHPLLGTMNLLARDLQVALLNAHPLEDRLLDTAPRPRTTLLGAIQADIMEDTLREYHDPEDGSVQVHLCTSPLRQVQALRDVLIRLFDENHDLEPRDVVVMSPDVEVYAPLVEAVFNDGAAHFRDAAKHESGLPNLPFRLADRGVRMQNQVADALLQFLDLVDSRLEAPDVVELLSLEPVRNRFGLLASDLPRARELLIEAGARWGRDAAHRQAEGQPDDDRYTWRFAIDRLLLGQALASPNAANILGHAPGCDIEGKDDRRIAGGVVAFAETVLNKTDLLNTSHTPEAWLQHLAGLVDALTLDSTARQWQSRQVVTVLEELGDYAAEAGVNELFDLRTIRTLLAGRLTTRETGQGFMNGAITVCEMVPLRSIPFKVVCMIGVDESSYPRIEPRPGYDRMALDTRPGDRNARNEDRALFLEAILSARHTLVITCTGRSDRTGNSLPLSVPVNELLETIRAMTPEESRIDVVHEHPLQPWSPVLFEGQASSFDARMARASHAWRAGRSSGAHDVPMAFAQPLPAMAEMPLDWTIEELVRFWRHPPTELVRRRLGIRLWESDDTLDVDSPIQLDGLENWALNDRILRAALNNRDLADLRQRELRGARLPLGTPGAVCFDTSTEGMAAFAESARLMIDNPMAPIDINVTSNGFRISGRVSDLVSGGRVVVHAGSIRPRHKLGAWIHHLLLHAHGWTGTSTVIGPKGGVAYAPLEPPESRAHLDALTSRLGVGLDQPIVFWAGVSHDYVTGLRRAEQKGNPDPTKSAFFSTIRAWGFRRDVVKEVDRWVVAGQNPFHFARQPTLPTNTKENPRDLAAAVWGPALDHEQEVQG